MNEFNNRMDAQRAVLDIVNRLNWQEELFGLSAKGLERWISSNDINERSPIVGLLRSASSKLCFLANKSQEQVTDEYRAISEDIACLTQRLEQLISEQN